MKIHAIINPSAVGSRVCQIEKMLSDCLGEQLKSAYVSSYRGDATYVARQFASSGADVVVAVGGDGTVHEVCNGIIGHKTALGIIPVGTANDLALSLGMPTEIDKACRTILTGRLKRIDLIRVNDRHFVTTGGLGMSGHAVVAAEYIRRRLPIGAAVGRLLGDRLYVLGLLCALVDPRNWHHRMTITTGGQSWEADAFSLTVGNLATLGGRFQLSPGAISDDGLLDVCVLNNYRSLPAMLQTVIRTTSGTHVELDSVNMLRCDRMRIDSQTPLTWFADGEIVCTDRTFEIVVVPGAIEVITPGRANEVRHVA